MPGMELEEVAEAEIIALGTLQAVGPRGVIEQASSIATELAHIIDARKLYNTISGRRFVRVEGWTTLGAMLGILPREVYVKRLDDGSFEAAVELIRASDAAIIGRGSAICGMDEPRWAKGPEYARRSMAITRATGKAYRLGFSWIITLAGYEPTPAEEVISAPALQTGDLPKPKIKAKGKTEALTPAEENGRPYPPKKIQTAIGNRIIKATPANRAAIASPGQKGLVAGKLEECFAPADDAKMKRHSVMGWLIDRDSVQEMTMAEASALLDWMLDKDADEGTFDLHPAVGSEAAAILAESLREAGQAELQF